MWATRMLTTRIATTASEIARVLADTRRDSAGRAASRSQRNTSERPVAMTHSAEIHQEFWRGIRA